MNLLNMIRKRPPHKKVNLRVEDILKMIDYYEYLKFQGENRQHCDRVLRQLKKKIYIKPNE